MGISTQLLNNLKSREDPSETSAQGTKPFCFSMLLPLLLSKCFAFFLCLSYAEGWVSSPGRFRTTRVPPIRTESRRWHDQFHATTFSGSTSDAKRALALTLQHSSCKWSSSSSRLHLTKGDGKAEYSDDFFGLIFIGSAVGFQDVIFSLVFLVLSFVAATTIRQQRRQTTNSTNLVVDTVKLPGSVAVTSWVVAAALKLVVEQPEIPTTVGGPAVGDPSTAALLEAVVCVASFAYTNFFLGRKES